MKTERLMKILKEFRDNGISHNPGKGLNLVLEFQDIIGRSNTEDIQTFEADLEQRDKEIFIFACLNCLSYDMSIDIIKATVISRYRKNQMTDIDNYMTEEGQKLSDRTRELNELESNIRLENDRLHDTITNLEVLNDNYLETIEYLKGCIANQANEIEAIDFFQGA